MKLDPSPDVLLQAGNEAIHLASLIHGRNLKHDFLEALGIIPHSTVLLDCTDKVSGKVFLMDGLEVISELCLEICPAAHRGSVRGLQRLPHFSHATNPLQHL